ncbi:neuferricin isoform X2 [Rhineura floridana]|uniref:neuferricin isoform X2 n=1 Tax=Rhineura floridana TaxID=261503 RepID=UPI002AC883A1|nr:neuferricin isoform X2 [Rhineura floridana]
MLRGALAALAVGWAAAWLWGRGFDPRAWLWRDGGAEPVLSAADLGRYTEAEGGAGLYLAVLGQVFDVQRGRKHYGPGGAYSFFAGKDASRAFATGDFTPAGLVDDISGLSPSEMLAIQNWLSFYRKNYVPIGKVAGRFYHENGAPTEVLAQAQALIAEGQRLKAQENEKKKQFPPCNSEWSSTGGSRVWCSKQSGGVNRDWNGVPRKLYEPGSSRSQCVCVNTEGLPLEQSSSTGVGNPNLQEYEGCHPLAEWCALKD